jgi:hypothetical protein
MSRTSFSGPVYSAGGFISDAAITTAGLVNTAGITAGASAAPIAITAAGSLNKNYATSSAVGGDTRLSYNKLTFTGAGSGETLRAFTVVATHVSVSIDGSGTIAGAANALRATLGGTSTNPGGTLAAIQADSDFLTGGTWTNASFIRFTNSNTGVVANLLNVPAAMVAAKGGGLAMTHNIKIVDSAGKAYYLMVTDTQ